MPKQTVIPSIRRVVHIRVVCLAFPERSDEPVCSSISFLVSGLASWASGRQKNLSPTRSVQGLMRGIWLVGLRRTNGGLEYRSSRVDLDGLFAVCNFALIPSTLQTRDVRWTS